MREPPLLISYYDRKKHPMHVADYDTGNYQVRPEDYDLRNYLWADIWYSFNEPDAFFDVKIKARKESIGGFYADLSVGTYEGGWW